MQSVFVICVTLLAGAFSSSAAEVKYSILARTGSPKDAEYPFGTGVGSKNQKILTNILSGEDYGNWDASYPDNETATVVSKNPDYFTIFDAPDDKKVAFVHLESPNPSQVYALGLDQSNDGSLTVRSSEPVDFSEWGGTWILCAGSISPWNTHLGGEEYEPDAKHLEEAKCLLESQCGEDSLEVLDQGASAVIGMLRYFDIYANNDTSIEDVRAVFNPYKYGYTIEVTPESGSNGKGSKWYTTGRSSQELAYIMPNNKTIYVTDDGTNVAFFRVEMDKPNDLSSTTIYAANLGQKSPESSDFSIEWVQLGSNTQKDLKAAIDSGIKFSDIFESVEPVNGTCEDGYKSINQGGDGQECLKLVAGQENIAAYLEARRYAAYLGATTEASKWEGFVYDPYTKQAYTSISDVRYGMEDFKKKGEDEPKYDVGGKNDIALPYNKCGCVFSLTFDDNYVAQNMNAALCGSPMEEDENGQACELDGISNPDNVNRFGKFILIGEDTDNHQNDYMWAWSPDTGKMTRVATTPYGSEVTGMEVIRGLNGGFTYLTLVTQHPYGETDIDQVSNEFSEGNEGYIGYWAIPASANEDDFVFNQVDVPMTQKEKSSLNVASLMAASDVPTPNSSGESVKSEESPPSSLSNFVGSSVYSAIAILFSSVFIF